MRLLHTTWPLFTAFRVRVRISWTIAIWPLFFLFGFTSWLPFEEALFWSVILTVLMFTTVWTHEMGHILAGRRCGIDTELMTLRGLGGLAHLDSEAQNPRDEIFVALAGPAVHLVWMAVLYPVVWLWPESSEMWMTQAVVTWFAHIQLALMIFNLLPVYPLDGGRVLRGALTFRMHVNKSSRHTAQVGFVGNGLLIAVGLVGWLWPGVGVLDSGSILTIWIGVAGIQACRTLLWQSKHGEIYAAHDPFARAMLQSKEVGLRADDEERKEREKRRSVREKAEAKRDVLQSTVDSLLDRINEVGGMDNLSRAERKELERASKALAEHDATA